MKTKLTSRKFWVSATGIVTSIVLMITADESLTQMIGGIVMMIADTVIYILAESEIDKAKKGEKENDQTL